LSVFRTPFTLFALGEWDLDADGLREEAESLESLSSDVGVENELEEESGRTDENVDFSSSLSSKDESEDDEEIASIFSLLEVTAPNEEAGQQRHALDSQG